MDHLVLAGIGVGTVLVLEGVERVWVGGEDLLEFALLEEVRVLLRERLEQTFLADSANVVAGIALAS